MAESPDPPSDRPARMIDRLCDRYEDGLRAGNPPPLEEFLAAAPEDVRVDLFRELVALEREFRERAGRPMTETDVRERFGRAGPWAGAVLDDIFSPEPALILEVVRGPYAGRSFPLVGHATFMVGRQPGYPIYLPDDPHLSRAHCMIEVNPPLARVVDLGSKSGVLVNGRRVAQADLRDGDEIRAGMTVFRVRVPAAQGGATLSLGEETGATWGDPPVITGYRFAGELGRGGMGVVFRATREADGEEVAVKTLLPAIPATRLAVQRFRRETAILRQLDHPNVVRFRDCGEASGLLYFVMEYVSGVNAGAVVARDGPLHPDRVRGWASQFLDALAYAHAHGFVHRDVKPSNLLVVGAAPTEVVKVSDFGLARAYETSSMSGLTVANMTGGTPAYMAPEQVTDFRNVRPAADQYSSAATLYHLLTGRTVYERATSVQELLRRILVEDPIPLRADAPALPDPFGAVIQRTLARDPADRFPDIRAMRAALSSA